MSSVGDLLPPRLPSRWTRSVAAGLSDELPVPIREAVDPSTAPVALLPWLAVHDGVRLWFSDWSEEKKRQVVAEGLVAAFEVGTRAGAIRFLGYVDATLVDAVAYPAPAFAGHAFAGHAWASFPPFLAIYLVSVPTTAQTTDAFAGSAFAGRAFAGRLDREPFDRALAALRAVKAPETEVRVDFRHHRPLTAGDRVTAGAGYRAGAYLPRTKL